MASLEDELRDMKLRNNDLAQKVQYWKMLASQREDEKLDLMKEINELRLKLSRLRSNGSVQANNFDAALQSAAQKALAHLVRASGEIATTMDLAKAYMRDIEELNNASPRWSSIGGTPSTAKKDKVHRVPPLMIGGQSIQPVVALTMLDTSNAISAARNSNPNRNVTERAMPMHMLQDVYIPLTRIDLQTQNMETEDTNNADDSMRLQLDENEEGVLEEDPQRMDEDEDFESTRILDAVTEDSEPEIDEETPPRIRTRSSRIENPLEGPSWMLDVDNDNQPSASKSRANLEPDSTTELEDYRNSPPVTDVRNKTEETTELVAGRLSREFSPTIRRRKRASSPPAPAPAPASAPAPAHAPAATPRRASQYSPRPAPARRISTSGRVLKVLVAKMRLEAETAAVAGASPPKRAAAAASHAPSPNGATVAGVIVSETSQNDVESLASGEPSPRHRPRHAHRHTLDGDDDALTDEPNLNERWVNVERRTEKMERNEQANIEQEQMDVRDEIRQLNDGSMEELQVNVKRRTESRDRYERTNSRERNKQIKREHSVEIQRSDSRERTNSREREERTNSGERNKQIKREHSVEIQRSDSRERTNSREREERTNSRERNKETNREHAMERQRSNSRERIERMDREHNERTDREKNERKNNRERHKQTYTKQPMETHRSVSREWGERTDRENELTNTDQNERSTSKERTNSRERNKHTNREHTTHIQTDRERNLDRQRAESEERMEYRHKQSSGDRSSEREDARTESRASDDLSHHDDTSRAKSAGAARAGSCDSDSGGEAGGRARRARRPVVYKEKPLNRKMRR